VFFNEEGTDGKQGEAGDGGGEARAVVRRGQSAARGAQARPRGQLAWLARPGIKGRMSKELHAAKVAEVRAALDKRTRAAGGATGKARAAARA
jgi:hypothetical protein